MQNKSGSGLVKWIILLGVLAVAGFFGFKYWQTRSAAKYEFETAPVTRGALTQIVTANGTLNPVINVQVGSQVSGNIQSLNADWNSQVTAGQVVAQIEPSIYKAALTQAEGDLANARAALELAQIQLKRTQDLRSKNSTPQSTLDQAVATEHQAEATVKIKDGSLALAKANLDHCTIVSPVDGIVISRSVDVGQTVAAGLNAPVLFTVANDLGKMQIDTNISEADVGNIKEDEDVDFFVDAFPTTTFHGKVIQVRNAATTVQNVVTYDAVISVSNPDLILKPGMTANVSIIIAHRDDALQIPNSVFRLRMPEELAKVPDTSEPSKDSTEKPGKRGKGKKNNPSSPTVYVLSDNETNPKPVKIKTGISDGINTEVLDGLKEGDKVVTSVIKRQTGSDSAEAANPFRPRGRF
jgi:HlyD family secretion protein